MTTQRDELARTVFIIDNRLASNPARVWDEADSDTRYYAYAIADGLIAAGYTKPRTITTGTRTSLVDSLLAYKGTPRHKLFEYPHRDDDSRRMIQEAEQVVAAFLAVLHEPTP